MTFVWLKIFFNYVHLFKFDRMSMLVYQNLREVTVSKSTKKYANVNRNVNLFSHGNHSL